MFSPSNEEDTPRNSIIPRYSKHSEELLINEQLRRSELHLGRIINYQTDNCSTIHYILDAHAALNVLPFHMYII